MGNGRVGQQTLHVGLTVRREIAQRAGDGGHQADDIHHEVPRRSQAGKARLREVCHRRSVDPRRRHAQTEADPQQQSHCCRLARDRQEAADLGSSPLEDVRAPEVERHRRQFECQADRHHQPAEGQHHHAPAGRSGIDDPRNFRRHARQVAGAQQAAQQADAVEHDARRSRTVHGVFESRLRTRLPALEQTRQGVGGNARHLHRHEDHQQVVGRGHQTHAQRRPKHERVEVGAVLVIWNARCLRERNVEGEESHQQEPDIGCQRVEYQQASKQLLAHDAAPVRTAVQQASHGVAPQIVPRIPEGEADASQCHDSGIEPTQHWQHPAEQHEHDRGGKAELGAEQGQRHGERVVERACDERAEVHGLVSFTAGITVTLRG